MATHFLDGSYETPREEYRAGQKPEISMPFRELGSSARVIKRRYVVRRALYAVAAKPPIGSFFDAVFKTAYFCEETDLLPYGAYDLCEFWRTFAEVPQGTLTDYASTTFQFPGVAAFRTDTEADDQPRVYDEHGARAPFSAEVPVRRSYNFLYTENPIADFELLGIFRPLWTGFSDDAHGAYEVDFVADPLIKDGDLWNATAPTASDYFATASAKGFIRSRDDIPERWLGNIWRRVREEVVAR